MAQAMREKAPGPLWWLQSAVAGLVGGAMMALVTMIWTFAEGNGFWWPLNVVAGAYPAFQPPMLGFEVGATMVGITTHLTITTLLGLAYGAVAAAFFPRVARDWTSATLLGLGWGVAIWAVVGAWIGHQINPFLTLTPTFGFFVAHLIYGVTTALIMCAFTRKRQLLITFAPETVEIERPRVGPYV